MCCFSLLLRFFIFIKVIFKLGKLGGNSNQEFRIDYTENLRLSDVKSKVRKHFNLDHLFTCSLEDTGVKVGVDTILSKGMRLYVNKKNINYRKAHRNKFFVLVKKKGSDTGLEKRFYKSLKANFNIDKKKVSFFKLENLGTSKAKITFETFDDDDYHQVLLQKNKLFINFCRYTIKVIRD